MNRIDVVYVLLYDEKCENVLMVKNIGNESSYYTLPGGAVEKGETIQEAAIREVKEETGLDVEVDGIFTVSEAFFEEREHHAIFFIFKGRIIRGKINILFPEEIEEISWIPSHIAEKHIHIPSELEGVTNKKNSVPYILRGNVVYKS
ncbi:NUDIX hydrolase [Viridibacillus sp. YIM B01967]|uniref:NUDIX hydrolase n=1 Tax=Viridibacillus soli TaxID=2798301 RepID=A0ABS1H6S3_9BACL|nr:NUDIX hydrolase [Viridibacillus soli]MBK3494999.1 NUDIX hydrolase [Viridibacillus soli]